MSHGYHPQYRCGCSCHGITPKNLCRTIILFIPGILIAILAELLTWLSIIGAIYIYVINKEKFNVECISCDCKHPVVLQTVFFFIAGLEGHEIENRDAPSYDNQRPMTYT